MAIIKIVNISNNQLPNYKTSGSAGMDIMAYLESPITLMPLERKLIPTGLFIALENGFEAQLRPRSGMAIKHGISLVNAVGTIDSDYRGEIKIPAINLSDEPFTIHSGDRIAQMIIAKYEQAEFDEVDTLDETDRGSGGFGSTGI
ncbi:MAG: dUTP diphosphatase [Clostridiales bacterium]|nr:dUTP diphosphatase [Clostridiales bacterium]